MTIEARDHPFSTASGGCSPAKNMPIEEHNQILLQLDQEFEDAGGHGREAVSVPTGDGLLHSAGAGGTGLA